MRRRYVMRRTTLTTLTNRYGKVVCHDCGKPIKVGDRVVSSVYRRCKYKIRHETCYESTFIK